MEKNTDVVEEASLSAETEAPENRHGEGVEGADATGLRAEDVGHCRPSDVLSHLHVAEELLHAVLFILSLLSLHLCSLDLPFLPH